MNIKRDDEMESDERIILAWNVRKGFFDEKIFKLRLK